MKTDNTDESDNSLLWKDAWADTDKHFGQGKSPLSEQHPVVVD
jgi:hypothetical protein